MVAAHLPAVALPARTVAEERIANAIEDGGLAGAGGSVYQEKVPVTEFPEIDHLFVGERSERVHLEQYWFHDALSSRLPATVFAVVLNTASAASPTSWPSMSR